MTAASSRVLVLTLIVASLAIFEVLPTVLIFEALRTPFRIHDTEVILAASIGIAVAPDHGDEPHDLFRNADLALYRAKETTGREFNYVVFGLEANDCRAIPTASGSGAAGRRRRPASAFSGPA